MEEAEFESTLKTREGLEAQLRRGRRPSPKNDASKVRTHEAQAPVLTNTQEIRNSRYDGMVVKAYRLLPLGVLANAVQASFAATLPLLQPLSQPVWGSP